MKKEFDVYTRLAIYEAMDECGVYDDNKLEQELIDSAHKLRSQAQFAELDDANYEEFLLALLSNP